MRAGRPRRDAVLLLCASPGRVCQYGFVGLIYRFLGNALWLLPSICVDRFLRTDVATQPVRDPDQKQASDDGFPSLADITSLWLSSKTHEDDKSFTHT